LSFQRNKVSKLREIEGRGFESYKVRKSGSSAVRGGDADPGKGVIGKLGPVSQEGKKCEGLRKGRKGGKPSEYSGGKVDSEKRGFKVRPSILHISCLSNIRCQGRGLSLIMKRRSGGK